MSKLSRYFSDNYIYFITVFTYQKQKVLLKNPELFLNVIRKVKDNHPVDYHAWVVLPDHFHVIIRPLKLTPAEIIHDFKLSYGAFFRKECGIKSCKLWQDRYWDHVIRNQNDLKKHIDYIHYNPVKHGLTLNPFDWELSSINKFEYQKDWGVNKIIKFEGDFGE